MKTTNNHWWVGIENAELPDELKKERDKYLLERWTWFCAQPAASTLIVDLSSCEVLRQIWTNQWYVHKLSKLWYAGLSQ